RSMARRDALRRVRRRRFRCRLLGAGCRPWRPWRTRTCTHRLGNWTRLGGQPRLADLCTRRALDIVLTGVRLDHVEPFHPPQPGRVWDRAPRLGVRLPQDGADASEPPASPTRIWALVAPH